MLLYKLIYWVKSFFGRAIAPRLSPIIQRLKKFSNTTVGQIISVILFPLYLVFRYIGWFVVVFLIPLALFGETMDLAFRAFGIAFGDKGSWVIFALTSLLVYGLPILSAFLYSNEQDDRKEERDRHGRELAKAQEELRAKQRALEDERQERAELQKRVLQLQQELEEKADDANEAWYVDGYDAGVADGLAQGREEGYSLGHSEGYKYALYTQNRFRYYNDDPPLTYEEARRSLDEGTDGANGELIEQEPPAPPARALGKKRRSRKKKPEPVPEPTTAAHEEPNDEELDRLFHEVKENYERNGFKLNTSDGYEYDAAGFDRNGLDRNGFTRDGLGSNGMLPYREPDKPATDMMSRLRREGLQGDPYLWDAPGDEDDAEEIAWPSYAERPTEEAALSNIE